MFAVEIFDDVRLDDNAYIEFTFSFVILDVIAEIEDPLKVPPVNAAPVKPVDAVIVVPDIVDALTVPPTNDDAVIVDPLTVPPLNEDPVNPEDAVIVVPEMVEP